MRSTVTLIGVAADGRKCRWRGVVYSVPGPNTTEEINRASKKGPWIYAGTGEIVPDGSEITVTDAERDEDKPIGAN